MIGFGFPMLVGLFCILCPCVGRIISPPNGTNRTFLPGSTANLTWKFDDKIFSLTSRRWLFNGEKLASISQDNHPRTFKYTRLSGIEIVKPATLLLHNVNQSYNGKYTFIVETTVPPFLSNVTVFIAEKPNVTINCSSPITLSEGGDVTCVCRGKGGNPPAKVTWFKDGKQIGKIKTENQNLTLSNVNETARGNYTCLAESHPNPGYKDNKTIVVQVNFKPKDTSITFSQNPAKLGNVVTIRCESRGFPPPNYTLTHNGTTKKTYTIPAMGWYDTGTYNCTASNSFGSDSVSNFLNVAAETGPKISPKATSNTAPNPTSSSSPSGKSNNGSVIPPGDDDDDKDVNIDLILGVLTSIIVIIGVGVCCCIYKKRSGGNRGDTDQSAGTQPMSCDKAAKTEGESSSEEQANTLLRSKESKL